MSTTAAAGGKVLDLAKFLGKAKDRLERVGVELEGGWTTLPPHLHDVGRAQLEHDGSIRGIVSPVQPQLDKLNAELEAAQRNYAYAHTDAQRTAGRTRVYEISGQMQKLQLSNPLHIGELPSSPMEVSAVEGWMRANYPPLSNESCGMHVHMSFKMARYYSLLMTPEYQTTIVAYVAKWAADAKLPKEHCIWERLNGKNEFCKLEYFPDLQVSKKKKEFNHFGDGNRYTAISYRHGETGTIECRLLPMMPTVDLAVGAVRHIIDVTNACLLALRQREVKHRVAMPLGGGNDLMREDRRLYV